MILYLTTDNILAQLAQTLGHPVEVRDRGLIEAAVPLPRASAGQG